MFSGERIPSIGIKKNHGENPWENFNFQETRTTEVLNNESMIRLLDFFKLDEKNPQKKIGVLPDCGCLIEIIV